MHALGCEVSCGGVLANLRDWPGLPVAAEMLAREDKFAPIFDNQATRNHSI